MADTAPANDIFTYLTALVQGHQDHERIAALGEVEHTFDDEGFWFLFRECYLRTRSLHVFHSALRDMLTPDRLNADERFSMHPEPALTLWRERLRRARPLKVYRGAETRNVTGFSWTTRRDIAEGFAFTNGATAPLLTIGYVDPNRIIATFTEEGRHEVLALPEHVKVKKVEELRPVPQHPANAARRYAEGYGLPIEAMVEKIRGLVDAGSIDLAETITSFGHERDYLRGLGFSKRPAMLDDLLSRLNPQDQEAA